MHMCVNVLGMWRVWVVKGDMRQEAAEGRDSGLDPDQMTTCDLSPFPVAIESPPGRLKNFLLEPCGLTAWRSRREAPKANG